MALDEKQFYNMWSIKWTMMTITKTAQLMIFGVCRQINNHRSQSLFSSQYPSRNATLLSNFKNIWTLPECMVNFCLVTGVFALQHVVQRFIDPLDSSHHMVSPLTPSFPVQWSFLWPKVAGDSSWGYALDTKRGENFFKGFTTSYLPQNHWSCYEWHGVNTQIQKQILALHF